MKVNISIDDVTPHPKSGLDVLQQCEILRSEFSEIKFTLFIPTAYYRTIPSPPESVCFKPLFISEFPDFCHILRELPPENYELAYHGHFHGIPGRSNNDEFQAVTASEASDIMYRMRSEATNAGLKFKSILRPPAWRMSPDAFNAAENMCFKTLALSPQEYVKKVYAGADESEMWKNRVVYCNANPPFIPLSRQEKLEIMYHACVWDKSYFSPELAAELAAFLRVNQHEFVFIEGLL